MGFYDVLYYRQPQAGAADSSGAAAVGTVETLKQARQVFRGYTGAKVANKQLCHSAAFGSAEVYVERLLPRARHIEVQIVGDGKRGIALFERECTLQRRHQKLIEIAPSPAVSPEVRERILAMAVRIAESVKYDNIGTFEFLLDADDPSRSFFIEANPRLQVEHTVTEEVTAIDLVHAQLQLAAGRTLAELHVRQSDVPAPRGYAIQLRINMETMDATGAPKPTGGRGARFAR